MQMVEEILAKIRNGNLTVPMTPNNRTEWDENLQAGFEML